MARATLRDERVARYSVGSPLSSGALQVPSPPVSTRAISASSSIQEDSRSLRNSSDFICSVGRAGGTQSYELTPFDVQVPIDQPRAQAARRRLDAVRAQAAQLQQHHLALA